MAVVLGAMAFAFGLLVTWVDHYDDGHDVEEDIGEGV